MMTKKTDLNSQCTPTNSLQFVQVTSERINSVTEIDSLEQFGQFLLNTFAPLFPAVCFESQAASQQFITWAAGIGHKRSPKVSRI
jgi:hypothetical protein